MAHTKGPWAHDPETHHIVSTTESEGWSVDLEEDPPVPKRIVCLYGAMGGDDSRADLALMTAAPELLEMVDRLVATLRRTPVDTKTATLLNEAVELAARARDGKLMKVVGQAA